MAQRSKVINVLAGQLAAILLLHDAALPDARPPALRFEYLRVHQTTDTIGFRRLKSLRNDGCAGRRHNLVGMIVRLLWDWRRWID